MSNFKQNFICFTCWFDVMILAPVADVNTFEVRVTILGAPGPCLFSRGIVLMIGACWVDPPVCGVIIEMGLLIVDELPLETSLTTGPLVCK